MRTSDQLHPPPDQNTAPEPPAQDSSSADDEVTKAAPVRPLLLHVGYHKTATSWLQKIVLTPEHHFHTVLSHEQIFETIIEPHALDFSPGAAADLYRANAQGAPAEAAVDVVSLEALSGLPYTGGRESAEYVQRLGQIFPKAKILITIREQNALIASVYMQYLFRSGTESPKNFFDEFPTRGFFRFSPDYYKFDRLVGLYQHMFGAENVLVLPQELIAADQAAAIATLADFSGNEPLLDMAWTTTNRRGESYPQFVVPVLRRVNYARKGRMNPNPMIDLGRLGDLMFRGVGWLGRRVPFARRIRNRNPVLAHVKDRFSGRYVDSNRRLAKMLHVPVPLKGYQGIEDDADT